jgi:hypothetical protein
MPLDQVDSSPLLRLHLIFIPSQLERSMLPCGGNVGRGTNYGVFGGRNSLPVQYSYRMGWVKSLGVV